MRLLEAVCARPWAIRPESLEAIIALADRANIADDLISAAMHQDPDHWRVDGVATRSGTSVEGATLLERRGPVAVLSIRGPIVRYGNLFASLSGGATSLQALAKDFQLALDDPSFRSILLEVDSPGGEASGIAEMADLILAARAKKPIWAYVSDLGASAAYWLASATDRIVVAETAALGSIGVVAAMPVPDDASGEIEFVSSVSPNKRVDPRTDSGHAQIQALVDTLGHIFVASVARNRGVSPEGVIRDFGAGGLLVGRDAVSAGLGDELGSFEGTVRALSDGSHIARRSAAPIATERPAAAIETERERTPVRVPIAAEARPNSRGWGTAAMSFLSRMRALLDEADLDPEASASLLVPDGSADQEALLMSQHLGGAQLPDQSGRDAPPIIAGLAVEPEVPPALANRLARLEAENARLRSERIAESARIFAREQITALRAMPAEEATIVALYSALASDDEHLGPLAGSDGNKTLRVTLISSLYAARPSRRDLTEEALGPAMTQVLIDRATATRAGRDPHQEADPERLAHLLSQTAAGRRALAESGHANGQRG